MSTATAEPALVQTEASEQVAKQIDGGIALSNKGLVLRSFEDMWRFAQMVYNSGLYPKGMDDPAKIMVAIQHGAELGLAPLQSVQGIAVINGRPSIWGDALLALVRSSSACQDVIEEVTDDGATCTCIRKGAKTPVTRTFTVEDAKKAGLWSKSGPWQQYPKRMLQMRARAFACRDAFPDLLKGVAVAEDILDIIDVDATERAVEAAQERTRSEQAKDALATRKQQDDPFGQPPQDAPPQAQSSASDRKPPKTTKKTKPKQNPSEAKETAPAQTELSDDEMGALRLRCKTLAGQIGMGSDAVAGIFVGYGVEIENGVPSGMQKLTAEQLTEMKGLLEEAVKQSQ